MSSSLHVLGFAPVWVSNWLTPVWILGVGAVAGLLLLFVIWLLATVFSRLPVVGHLADDGPRLRKAAGVLAGAMLAVAVPAGAWLVAQGHWPAGQGGSGWVWLLALLVPAAGLFWVLALSLLTLVSRRTVAELPMSVQEGVLWPLLWVAVSLAGFGLLGSLIVRQPAELLSSLPRLLHTGSEQKVYEIPPLVGAEVVGAEGQPASHPIDVTFRRSEVRKLVFRSSEPLEVGVEPEFDLVTGVTFDIRANEEFTWAQGEQSVAPFTDEQVTHLYVRNLGADPARLELTVDTAPAYPEVAAVPITALALAGLFLLYVLQGGLMPKVSAVALSTFKSETAQPLFGILLALGVFALILFVLIPYNTFGEDIKMLKDSGLTLIMVLCILLAVWAASTSVSEEIEGRTALTVLSKPISRRSFLLGKFLGIVWTVGLLFLVLGLVLLVAVAYKPIFDAREGAETDPTWQLCFFEMIRTVPGLVLAFMETLVLAALSVAISTRLPMVANFVICFSVYVLGHLTPLIVQSAVGQFEVVAFVGQLIATVFPNLDHFNIQAAVAAGVGVPYDYLGWTMVYCAIYTVIAMLLGLVMFEDRDVA